MEFTKRNGVKYTMVKQNCEVLLQLRVLQRRQSRSKMIDISCRNLLFIMQEWRQQAAGLKMVQLAECGGNSSSRRKQLVLLPQSMDTEESGHTR
jgi:hypothetical protein